MKTLFGEREKKIARAPVENSSTSITQIARQLFAMSQKKTEANLVSSLRNERYARTFTDEYPFARKLALRPLRPVDAEQKKWWERLAAKNAPPPKRGFTPYTAEQLREIYRRNTEPPSEQPERARKD